MANMTEEYWEVDGVSLSTYAWRTATLEGREGIPTRRGSNQVVAYRSGQIWRPKVYDARTLLLAMWVIGQDADGEVPAGTTGRRAQFYSNLDTLKSLFGKIDSQLALTKRKRTLSGLIVQTGLGECLGTLEPKMFAKDGAAFVAEILMADPFWYGVSQNTVLPVGTNPITNPGTYKATKMTIRLNGPLTDPVLTNLTANPDISVTYTGVISGGNWVELNTDTYTALTQAGVSVIGNVSHAGARSWMELLPGVNSMQLAVSAGTGTASVTFLPPNL